MARGWESKSVEMQMETNLAGKIRVPASAPTPEEIERKEQRASLALSRIRILNDLKKAKNPRYRQILMESLEFLEQKLKLLE